jgi:structural maintenance of chromosome 2
MCLLQDYPWITSEKPRFGRPGTEYDFAARDPEKAFQEYHQASQQVKDLGKDVNRRVSILAVSRPEGG